MKKFFFKVIYFTFYTIVLSAIVLGSFMALNKLNFSHIPAINLSNSYSFNEKMTFLKENKTEVEIMAIGSSMSLNNLHSESIVDVFSTNSYINTSTWGANMEEIYNFLKITYPYFKPNTILLCSNMYDYMESIKTIRFDKSENYLAGDYPTWWIFLKTFDLSYYFKNFTYAKMVRTNPHTLYYLDYDAYGAVGYDSPTFEVEEKRYNLRLVDDIKIDEIQYAYLDSISLFCKNNNVKLLFLQGPIRSGITSTYTPSEWSIIEQHQKKVKDIVSEDHYFYDANELEWDDSYFYDPTHLNVRASERYTRHILSKHNIEK